MPITFTKSVNLCWLLALQPKGKFIDLTFNKYRHGICNYSKSSWYKARIQDSGLGIIVCILETKFYIYVDGEKGETGSARRDGTWDPTYRPSSVNFYKYFYDYAYRFAGAACAEKPCSTVGTWVVWTVSIIAADSKWSIMIDQQGIDQHDVMPKNWDHVDEFASSPLKFSLLLTTFFIVFNPVGWQTILLRLHSTTI